MKCFVAVTRLIKDVTIEGVNYHSFHFKGAYEGQIVKGLLVKTQSRFVFTRGDDYLLYLALEGIREGFLMARLIKSKSLNLLRY